MFFPGWEIYVWRKTPFLYQLEPHRY